MNDPHQISLTEAGRYRRLVMTVTSWFFIFFIVMSSMFFLPAGTLAYWQAWLYLALVLIPVVAVTLYFLIRDPEVIEKRLKVREKEREQRAIIGFGYIVFIATFLLPGFDRRFGWSDVPVWLVIVSDCLIVLGYLLFAIVLRENRFASRVVEVEQGRHVITTGPYAIVRHPMYVGALLIYLFSPLALGSYPALLGSILFVGIIVARILNEEKVLLRDLEGYAAYMLKTQNRLIPGIW